MCTRRTPAHWKSRIAAVCDVDPTPPLAYSSLPGSLRARLISAGSESSPVDGDAANDNRKTREHGDRRELLCLVDLPIASGRKDRVRAVVGDEQRVAVRRRGGNIVDGDPA